MAGEPEPFDPLAMHPTPHPPRVRKLVIALWLVVAIIVTAGVVGQVSDCREKQARRDRRDRDEAATAAIRTAREARVKQHVMAIAAVAHAAERVIGAEEQPVPFAGPPIVAGLPAGKTNAIAISLATLRTLPERIHRSGTAPFTIPTDIERGLAEIHADDERDPETLTGYYDALEHVQYVIVIVDVPIEKPPDAVEKPPDFSADAYVFDVSNRYLGVVPFDAVGGEYKTTEMVRGTKSVTKYRRSIGSHYRHSYTVDEPTYERKTVYADALVPNIRLAFANAITERFPGSTIERNGFDRY